MNQVELSTYAQMTLHRDAARVLAVDIIARVAHEANRAYCAACGDDSQKSWDEAADWQQESARNGVRGIIDGRIVAPQQSHESWMDEKLAQGWRFGQVKDEHAKTHPCLVPYDKLPEFQKVKDALFFGVVRALMEAK